MRRILAFNFYAYHICYKFKKNGEAIYNSKIVELEAFCLCMLEPRLSDEASAMLVPGLWG